MNKKDLLFQFRIELLNIEPAIWRRIQVPRDYSFWDLHVAIQDAMGWLDYHLHEFEIKGARMKKPSFIGIPPEDYYIGDPKVLPGWEIPIKKLFDFPGRVAGYRYDFGDRWLHVVLFEAVLLKERGRKYPACVDGKRACPPEDCGGVPGYYELLQIVKNPEHPEYEENAGWLKGHIGNYWPYDPDFFDPRAVSFDNPKKRFQKAFQELGP